MPIPKRKKMTGSEVSEGRLFVVPAHIKEKILRRVGIMINRDSRKMTMMAVFTRMIQTTHTSIRSAEGFIVHDAFGALKRVENGFVAA
mmetsp:Transcript_30259/g.88502  ORF Transcript_30259/g.88502 Transcript_30259/m.88502 type:complete len:88 (+) Transcript_30259:383-646(+)